MRAITVVPDRPGSVPCRCCAVGAWDMCRNGRYTERGIKELPAFGAERWRIEPEFAVPVAPALGALGVLLEPASIVAKAWEHVDRILARACSDARVALVTGAGPSGCSRRSWLSSAASRPTCSTSSPRVPSPGSSATWGRPTTPTAATTSSGRRRSPGPTPRGSGAS
jgi:threonine dehydrogenase-like Zn-dependent dehydrogenase